MEQAPFPRTIHQIWFQGESEMPDKFRAMCDRVRELNPGWGHVLWDQESIEQMVDEFCPEPLQRLYASYRYMIQKIDLAKYLILMNFGGLYVDMDTWAVQGFDRLPIHWDELGEDEVVVSKTKNTVVQALKAANVVDLPCIATAFLACRSGARGMAAILSRCNNDEPAWYQSHGLRVVGNAGPVVVAKTAHAHPNLFLALDPVYLSPTENGEKGGVTDPRTVAVHMYSGLWAGSEFGAASKRALLVGLVVLAVLSVFALWSALTAR